VGHETPATAGAEVLEPAVVGAGVRERVARIRHLGLPLETEARVEERRRDPVTIEECETRAGIGRGDRRALGVATRNARGRQLLERLPHATESAEHLGRRQTGGAAIDLEEVPRVRAATDADGALAVRGIDVA